MRQRERACSGRSERPGNDSIPARSRACAECRAGLSTGRAESGGGRFCNPRARSQRPLQRYKLSRRTFRFGVIASDPPGHEATHARLRGEFRDTWKAGSTQPGHRLQWSGWRENRFSNYFFIGETYIKFICAGFNSFLFTRLSCRARRRSHMGVIQIRFCRLLFHNRRLLFVFLFLSHGMTLTNKSQRTKPHDELYRHASNTPHVRIGCNFFSVSKPFSPHDCHLGPFG